MKQGWQIKKLGDLYPIRTGKTPSRGDMTLWDGSKQTKNLWVSIADITANEGGLITDTNEYISDKACDKFPIVNKGALLVSFKLSLGRMAFAGANLRTNEAILSLDPIDSIVHRFLYYYLLYFDWDKAAEGDEKVKGKTLNQKKLAVIPIPVPPLSEQQRIVSLLDAEFAKIDTLKANAERNLQNAKDLFQAALKKELEPKEGWKTKRIEEIAEIKGGKRVPKGYKLIAEKTPHPYIRVSDFNDSGSVDLDDIHYIEEWVYKDIQRYTISFKDVYISIAGTIGKSGIIPKELEGANLTENACKLVLNQGLYNRYVYYCTINEPFKSQIVKLTMQAAQPKLALTRLATATICIPSLSEQQSIVARLDALNEKCKTLQANYEKTLSLCDDLKQALLRKAFNGEI